MKPLRLMFCCVLFFSALIVLTTCQLQFNKSTGYNVALQVVVPPTGSAGAKSTRVLGTNGKDLAGGTSLTVTITPPSGSPQTLSTSIGRKSIVDFSFNLSSSGTYQVSVNMLDGSGDLLSTVSTKFAVPTGNYPVVLNLPSNLLTAVFTWVGSGPQSLTPAFGPTIYSYTSASEATGNNYTLTLTTVDPSSMLSVTETDPGIAGSPFIDLPPGSSSGSTCSLHVDSTPANTVTIVVTAPNGVTQNYTLTIPAYPL